MKTTIGRNRFSTKSATMVISGMEKKQTALPAIVPPLAAPS